MAREVLQVLQQLSINFQTSLLRAEEREEAQSGIHGGAAELSSILVRLRCFRSHGAVLSNEVPGWYQLKSGLKYPFTTATLPPAVDISSWRC